MFRSAKDLTFEVKSEWKTDVVENFVPIFRVKDHVMVFGWQKDSFLQGLGTFGTEGPMLEFHRSEAAMTDFLSTKVEVSRFLV